MKTKNEATSMQTYVKAGKNPIPFSGGIGWEAGAFGMIRTPEGVRCQFLGTHQVIPFYTVGRTPGRALRRMRRALELAKIPVR